MIKIICVGKMKEKAMIQLQEEYLKRLSRFNKVELIELKEANPSFEENKLIDDESQRILQLIKPDDFVLMFDVRSQQLDSIDLSRTIDQNPHCVILLGGSLGFSDELKQRANLKISMSQMTFPHLLARIMVLEQLYRSYKIINNQTYHK